LHYQLSLVTQESHLERGLTLKAIERIVSLGKRELFVKFTSTLKSFVDTTALEEIETGDPMAMVFFF